MTKKKREKQKIRVFTAFSGYDSQMMAMKRLERDYPDLIECELVGWSEIDGPAIKSHNAVFPEAADLNLGDISKINWEEVPDFDLFTYSSPCFVAGTKVRTKSGYKNIEDIQIGDEVVSHTGNYRKVTDVMSHEYTGMFLIEVSGSVRNAAGYQRGTADAPYYKFKCTPNHQFYVLENGADTQIWKKICELNEDYSLYEIRRYDDITNIDDVTDSDDVYKVWFTPEHYELVKNTEPTTVYNLTVDIDNSYNVYDVICHNCQDFSRCGIQRGGEAGSGTRSSLLWECERAIREKKPKFCLLENVKALYSDKKFHSLLMRWKKMVDDYGYHSYIKVINAADMDVPQGRERVFMVSVRNDIIETVFGGKDYRFPAPMPRKRKIEDFLQDPDEVPEEYYLKSNKLPKFLNLLTHAGDEFEKNLSEEAKAAIKSAPMSIIADQPENMPLDSSVNNGLEGYVPKKSQNQLF